MYRNCVILGGRPFVKIEGRRIVGRWIMSVRRLLKGMGMMTVWMCGVSGFWPMSLLLARRPFITFPGSKR
mgnify:CR=1 FL=1